MADDLTDERKAIVRKTWAPVHGDVRGIGVEFFIKLFREKPQYQQYFKLFKDKTLAELATNSALRAHATSVMHQITAIVESLDDLDCLVEILMKQARNHLPRGLEAQHYKELFEVLLAFLGEKLGAAFDDKAKDAWTVATSVMAAILGSQVTQLQEQNK